MKIAGIILIAVAVLCIIVGRSNLAKLRDINDTIIDYKNEHPIKTAVFGVPLTDKARADAASAASFAYSFTPPLQGVEIFVYVMLVGGVILTWAGTTQRGK
jgi:hypothetical protein